MDGWRNQQDDTIGGLIELQLPTVVIGRTIKALLYAYKNELPIILNKPVKPSDVEFIDLLYDFSFLHFDKRPTYGDVWDRLVFALGMGGYMIAPDLISNLRHEKSKKKIVFVSSQGLRVKVEYDVLIEPDLKETGNVFIYDWFDMRTGSQNCPDVIRGNDDSPQRLVFYPSRRPKVIKGIRDFVAISKVKEKILNDWDYSEMAIKHSCLKIFKTFGIKGAAAGYTRHGKQRYSPIKIEHGWREIKNEIKSAHTLEELCKMKQKGSHLTNLTTNLFLTTKTSTSQE